MLSSNSSSCNHNPFTENDITSISHHNSFFAFPPSPHLHLPYDYDFSYLDHFYHHAPTQTNEVINPAAAPAAVKKDRHSKISTARGLRDRRMRLSLDVARKFFDLQDLLGYEKASRTVDWLLRSSRTAIRELARASRCRESCASDEAVSSSTTDKMAVEASSCSKVTHSRRGKRGRAEAQQKRASVGRESRKKARERARERTSQKRRLMRENSSNTAAAAAATTSTTAFGESHSFPVDLVKDWRSDEAANEGAFFFNFHHNINNNNNNNNNAAFLHQEEVIAELEYNGRPWEAYNSFNLFM